MTSDSEVISQDASYIDTPYEYVNNLPQVVTAR